MLLSQLEQLGLRIGINRRDVGAAPSAAQSSSSRVSLPR